MDVSSHVETVVLLRRVVPNDYIYVDLDVDKLEGISGASATYEAIQDYILEKYGFKVSNLYIAQVKEELGIKERENYNLPKGEGGRVPKCPQEKKDAIIDALRHFKVIDAGKKV